MEKTKATIVFPEFLVNKVWCWQVARKNASSSMLRRVEERLQRKSNNNHEYDPKQPRSKLRSSRLMSDSMIAWFFRVDWKQ